MALPYGAARRFAKRACYTVADIFVGYNNRTVHEANRELTAFQSTDHGLLQLCVLPQGFVNAVAEFQMCMLSILQDEVLRLVGVFVDDVGIKGPATRCQIQTESLKPYPKSWYQAFRVGACSRRD